MPSLGILDDKYLHGTNVPGTVTLFAKAHATDTGLSESQSLKKHGDIVLTPQPHDDPNDPLNWKQWRRDVMLVVIGFHSLVGGGQTPILAAGFKEVSSQFNVSLTKISYTTGAYMFALGIGSVIAGPLAILYGKRPIYLAGQVLFCAACIWAALSPSYASLVAARIVEGFGVSPVECLPSSSIGELYFLHERAFRLGIYTMLLLGGKNIVPLVSAAIIQSFGWRWVFGIVAMIVALNFVLTFFFVPETSWDRAIRPIPSLRSSCSGTPGSDLATSAKEKSRRESSTRSTAEDASQIDCAPARTREKLPDRDLDRIRTVFSVNDESSEITPSAASQTEPIQVPDGHTSVVQTSQPQDTSSHNQADPATIAGPLDRTVFEVPLSDVVVSRTEAQPTYVMKSWAQQLAPTQGRISRTSFWKIALRPFILYAYPSILFSTIIYSFSVVWLIVMSESLSQIFSPAPYHFSSLSIGLIYVSPFIGGILGSSVSGKLSDILVRYMARKNGGVYEPEFRLVLAIPVALVTSFGLIGFGWSTYVKDPWIAPTIFFGCISFGCSLGSTMSISFVVDSYKQHASEALVTLNLTKNTLGFIFSLWYNDALTADGSRTIFIILGVVQVVACFFAIPLYIYGKRCRSWTSRSGMIDWLYD